MYDDDAGAASIPAPDSPKDRLPVELPGALRQKLEEQDVQQDVQRLLQPLQLRAAGNRPGDTPPLPLL
jgi:hypothetical protein